jgi:hypothetical protein
MEMAPTPRVSESRQQNSGSAKPADAIRRVNTAAARARTKILAFAMVESFDAGVYEIGDQKFPDAPRINHFLIKSNDK